MNNVVRLLLKRGLVTDLARIPHALDLSSPAMATTVNCALKVRMRARTGTGTRTGALVNHTENVMINASGALVTRHGDGTTSPWRTDSLPNSVWFEK